MSARGPNQYVGKAGRRLRRLLVVFAALSLVMSLTPAAGGQSAVEAPAADPSPIEKEPTDGEPGPPPDEREDPVFDVVDVAGRSYVHEKAPNSDIIAEELARPGLVAAIERIAGAVERKPGEAEKVRFDKSDFPVGVETDRGVLPDGSDVVLEVVDPATVREVSPFGAVFDIRFLDASSRKVRPSDGVTVTVDFTDVGIVAGGGAQERLRLALFTGCTENDDVWSCSSTERLETSFGEGRTLSATLSADQIEALQGAVSVGRSDGFRTLSGGTAYFGIVTSPDGPNGNFAAGVSPGPASFEVGLQAGTAQASYPIALPPAPYGPMPDVTLSYSSAVPDGMSAAENTQASWVGLGWSLSAGSITRHYETCDDTAHEGDLCDAGDFYSLTLGGVSSPLIQYSGNSFRLASDPHWRVERKFNVESLNPDDQGEWWEVTTTDGTVYEFGHNRTISGWFPMNSVQTVWAHSHDAGGACDNFTGDSCDKGWRWDLSTVRDTHGNEATYHYTQEENEFHSGDGGTLKEYVRAAHLKSIKYANGRVDFVTDNRCADEEPCTGSAQEFPDVPTDLQCTGGTCQDSPSFWTGLRLRAITTGVWHQSSWQDAGKWELDYSFPDPPQDEDDEGLLAASYPKLWLDSIQRIDVIGSPPATVPATTFAFEWLDNRVNHPAGVAAMTMARLDTMTNELGGQTRFTYGQTHACVVGQVYTSQQHQNLDCFRAWDLTQDPVPVPGIVMWHKYKVLSTVQDPMLPTGSGNRAESITTTYTYGAPQWVAETGPLPPHDGTGGVLWTEYRGHEDVTATMTSGDYTDYRFHRGLGGTYTLSDGTQETDHDWLNGRTAEVSSHVSGGTMLGRTITVYEEDETASMASDNGTQYAYWVAPDVIKTTTKGATNTDTSRVEYDYDSYGNVTFERLLGDEAITSDRRTVQYEYTLNTTLHIVSLPKVVSLASGWRNANNKALKADQLARTEILYDDNTYYWNPPTKGDPTDVRVYYDDLDDPIGAYTYRRSLTSYDTYGRVKTLTDAEGNTTEFDFDTFGHVDEVENALDQVTTYVTDPKLGVVTQVTDPNNESTIADYDGLGRLLGVERPTDPSGTDGVQYTYTYPDRGSQGAADDTMVLTTKTLLESGPNVFVTSATHYDGLGRVVQTDAPRPQNSAQAVVGLVDYDADGRVVREGIPFIVSNTPGAAYVAGDVWVSGGVVHDVTTYAGNTTTVTRKQGATTVWSSQSVSDGWEVTSTDAEGNTTTYLNDAFGQLVKVEEDNTVNGNPVTYTTTYAYDLSGNLTTVTDDANNATSMTYDRLGQKRTMDDPDSGDWTYVYDGVGNLTSQQDGEGDWLFFEYDGLGRVLDRHADSLSGPLLAEFAYDAPFVGALDWSKAYVTGGEVTVEYTDYDEVGRLEARTLKMPGSQNFKETFTYNNAGNVVTRAYPDGATGNTDEVVTYDYDLVSGLPLTLTGDGTFGDDDYVTSTTYNPFGQITAQQAGTGDGIYWDPAYDVHTRLERSLVRQGTSAGAISQDYNYDRDDNGLITRIWDDTVVNDQFQCFTYDDLGRLKTGFTGDWLCRWYRSNGPDPYYFSYQYDSIGNLTKKGGVTLTYSGVDAGPHAVTKYGTDDFAYDGSGNMESRDVPGGTQTLEWDDDHQLDSVAGPSGTTSFLYDADGNRVKRTTGSESTVYVGGVYEYTTAGATTTETSYYVFGGRTVAVRNGSDLHYLAQDHLGSTSLTRDGSSGGVSVHRYKPFGDPRGTSAPTETDHTYTGQIADSATDLMFYNARYYDPTIARFISPDTVMPDFSNPQDLNRYSYVRNNPVNNIDPSGHRVDRPYLGRSVYELEQDTGIAVASNQFDQAMLPTGAISECGLQWCFVGYPGTQGTATYPLALDLAPIGDWVVGNRGTLATVGATGWCLVPAAGWLSCGYAQGIAFSFRTQQLHQEEGLTGETASLIALDALVTGITVGAGSGLRHYALEELAEGVLSLTDEAILVIVSRQASGFMISLGGLSIFITDPTPEFSLP